MRPLDIFFIKGIFFLSSLRYYRLIKFESFGFDKLSTFICMLFSVKWNLKMNKQTKSPEKKKRTPSEWNEKLQ